MTNRYDVKTLDAAQGSIILAEALGFAFESGTFVEALTSLTHSSVTSDNQVRSFVKTLTDNSLVADAAARAFEKARQDSASTVDERVFAVLKSIVDASSATDLALRSIVKPALADTVAASEQLVMSFSNVRIFVEAVSATDDLDGAATAEDDQEMQFTKTRSDTATALDAIVRTLAQSLADTASITDTGLLRSQGYTPDFTYFLEDYVGVSRTL